MRRILAIILLLGTLCSELYSQEIISSSGAVHTTSSNSIEWTIGEIAIESYSSDVNILTTGFHQPLLAPITSTQADDSGLFVYPSPTRRFLTIVNSNDVLWNAELLALVGQSLIKTTSSERILTLDLQSVPAGYYLLYVTNQRGKTHLFKIIKSNE